jgi:hypothetical protein
MHAHLVTLLAAQVVSAVLGLVLLGIGIADVADDTYGLVLGFVGIFNGIALLACFVVYVFMVRKQMVFPKVLIGFSAGLSIVCLQSMFVWAGFQTTLFENYTQKIFELDKALALKVSTCQGYCVDFKSGSFDLMDTVLAGATQDHSLEKAGTAISVLAFLAQVVIGIASFLILQAQKQGAASSNALGGDEGADRGSLDAYTPAPAADRERSLLANLE